MAGIVQVEIMGATMSNMLRKIILVASLAMAGVGLSLMFAGVFGVGPPLLKPSNSAERAAFQNHLEGLENGLGGIGSVDTATFMKACRFDESEKIKRQGFAIPDLELVEARCRRS